MQLNELMKMVDFPNLLGGLRGSFVIDPRNSEAGYRDGGTVFPLPHAAIKELYESRMERSRAWRTWAEAERRSRAVVEKWLDHAIVYMYGTENVSEGTSHVPITQEVEDDS